MRLALSLTLLAAVAPLAPAAAQQEMPPTPGPAREYRVPPRKDLTLPNGMRVTFVHYGQIPKVSMSLFIATGGIDEAPDQIQLASLTASLLVEGTATRSAQDISRQAAEMGGSLTSGAGDDDASVGGTVLSDFGPRYVALLADVILHPRFAEADVERLRNNTIRNNAISLSQPGQIARIKFREMLFGDHPYGQVFASEEMLKTYTSDKVRDFYSRNFGARRAHLYVGGVFNQPALERAIRRAFAPWAPGRPATSRPPTPVTHHQLQLFDRPDAVQSTIRMGLPVADPANPDWIRLDVTNALLGGSFGSRITANLREDKGYSYSPFSFVASWPHLGVWLEVADVTTNVTGPSIKESLYEVNRLREEPPPEKELAGIRNNLAGVFVIQNSSRGGLIGQLRFVDEYGLGDGYLASYVKNVLSVTPEQVQQTARKYLDPSRMTITVVGDKAKVESQLEPYKAGVP